MTVVALSAIFPVCAQEFHCADDTVKAMEIIRFLHEPGGNVADKIPAVVDQLIGVKYVPLDKLDGASRPEIRLDGLDQMGFVNAVIALAKAAVVPGTPRIQDFSSILESITFRRGEADGFHTKMIYPSVWIVDNKARGNVTELTETYSDVFKTKSLEYVSRNRDEYADLKDSTAFENQKMMEMGYRTHKIPHLKRQATDYKTVMSDLKNGDLIMILSSDPNYDVLEAGFIVERPDGFHFVHASEKDGKVIEEQEPLSRYIKRIQKYTYGWRWLRVL